MLVICFLLQACGEGINIPISQKGNLEPGEVETLDLEINPIIRGELLSGEGL